MPNQGDCTAQTTHAARLTLKKRGVVAQSSTSQLRSRDKAVTHPEEEDAPHQHGDDRHEAYGIRDLPNIVQMACLKWGFVLVKTG